MQWLMEFSPQGLPPHSPCALLHACFVLSLAHYLNNRTPSTESAIYEVWHSLTTTLLITPWPVQEIFITPAFWHVGRGRSNFLFEFKIYKIHCCLVYPSQCFKIKSNISPYFLDILHQRKNHDSPGLITYHLSKGELMRCTYISLLNFLICLLGNHKADSSAFSFYFFPVATPNTF